MYLINNHKIVNEKEITVDCSSTLLMSVLCNLVFLLVRRYDSQLPLGRRNGYSGNVETKKLTAAVALFNHFSVIPLMHFSTSSSYLGIFNLVSNTELPHVWRAEQNSSLIYHLDQQSFYSLCCLTFLHAARWLKELVSSTLHISIPVNKMQ